MPDEPTPEPTPEPLSPEPATEAAPAAAAPAPPAPPAAPALPVPGPTPFGPPPSFIQSPPPNQAHVPQHVVPVQHVSPPTPVSQRDGIVFGPGALIGLLVWNLGMVSYFLLNKYWLDNSFGDDWWSLLYGGAAALALFGLVLVTTGPIGSRIFGLLSGALGCVPLLHEAADTSIDAKNFVTRVLTVIIVPGVLGIMALASQPRSR